MDKEFEKEIIESLDELGENIKKSDKIKDKKEVLEAYKKIRKIFKQVGFSF